MEENGCSRHLEPKTLPLSKPKPTLKESLPSSFSNLMTRVEKMTFSPSHTHDTSLHK